MPSTDMTQEAARWFALAGLAGSACVAWLLLFLGAHLAHRDRWRRPLLLSLPVVLGLTGVAIAGLLLSGDG